MPETNHPSPPHTTDTIAAIATAVGGALAVIRISGPAAFAVVDRVWRGAAKHLADTPPRTMQLGRIIADDNAPLDQALAVRFAAPASYTGEDMVELHCHGGGLAVRNTLIRLLDAGARNAEPGEFTKRAFVNGKMDLTQAEAVADIIAAHSDMALRMANRQLDGALGRQTREICETLEFILGETESRLDFPEEELDWMPPAKIIGAICELRKKLNQLLRTRLEGEILRDGVRLVLAGPPNVGKSSLMNAILGRDRAIVTHIPGTTRDVLEEFAHIRGIPVRVIDTAGIREAKDLVERSGIDRTLASMREAQVLLWVFDASANMAPQEPPPEEFKQRQLLYIGNKIDLNPNAELDAPAVAKDNIRITVYTSAREGIGLDKMFDEIERLVWKRPHEHEPEIAVGARHAKLIEQAAQALEDVPQCIETEQWELAAVCLRTALDAGGRVIGRTVDPDVLENIFARFCIGK